MILLEELDLQVYFQSLFAEGVILNGEANLLTLVHVKESHCENARPELLSGILLVGIAVGLFINTPCFVVVI